jgi:hypothetical protein
MSNSRLEIEKLEKIKEIIAEYDAGKGFFKKTLWHSQD